MCSLCDNYLRCTSSIKMFCNASISKLMKYLCINRENKQNTKPKSRSKYQKRNSKYIIKVEPEIIKLEMR